MRESRSQASNLTPIAVPRVVVFATGLVAAMIFIGFAFIAVIPLTISVISIFESCQIKVGRSVKISAFDLQRVDVQIRHIDIALTEPVSLPCSGVTG